MIQVCSCGSWIIENKDLCLCASCNKRNRTPEPVAKVKKPINKFSKTNKLSTSNGVKYTKSQVEGKVAAAKLVKKALFIDEHGCLLCEECGTNEKPIDPAHIISVDECQKRGMVELAWDLDNLKLLCRRDHQIKDKNIINYKNGASK